jgi:adenylate cyclase
VRCGIAQGDLVPYAGDLFGVPQAEAARLCSLADPGQVAISASVHAALPDDVEVEDLGEHALRGLPTSGHIYRLVAMHTSELRR